MSKGFSKVVLMGNLTRDPENRTTSGGQNVTNFSLAVNRSWKSADGTQQEQVSFINCVAWGKTGEIISQYVSKGNPLLVSGRLDQRSWDDKDSGQKRTVVEVIVEDFNFISSNRNSDGTDNGNRQSDNSGSSNSSDNNTKTDDVVIQDIDDKPIDLSEIPF